MTTTRATRETCSAGVPGAAPQVAGAYEARTPDERHLAALMERLPQMQRVDDLGAAIDGLEAQEPLDTPEGRRLYTVLLNEKRAAYRDEKARLDRDVERSGFASIVEAHAARLDPAELAELERELNRFREDYALTLAKCQGA